MSDQIINPLPAPVGKRMCLDCTFWQQAESEDGTMLDYGQCRRNPPSFGPPIEESLPGSQVSKLGGVWVWTRPRDWCGEYKL